MFKRRRRYLNYLWIGLLWCGLAAEESKAALRLSTEVGQATPLNIPDTTNFKMGETLALNLLWRASPHFSFGPSVATVALPAKQAGVLSFADYGTAFSAGGTFHLEQTLLPWVSLGLLYTRTGLYNLPSFAVSTGYNFKIGAKSNFALGPFVKYMQADNSFTLLSRSNTLPQAGFSLVILGINMDFAVLKSWTPINPLGPEVEPMYLLRAANDHLPSIWPKDPPFILAMYDRDNDGVNNDEDECPDEFGLKEYNGCPEYRKLVKSPREIASKVNFSGELKVAGQDKLKLSKKPLMQQINFAKNSSVINKTAYPLLTELIKLLVADKNLIIELAGYASVDGTPEQNQALSEARALAVLRYLIAAGIERERIFVQSFSSLKAIAGNDTESERELNRRVELLIKPKKAETVGYLF